MAKVLIKLKDKIPDDAVFIGRPSKWGNPFKIGKDYSRGEAISAYKDWLTPKMIQEACNELKGKDLVCFCSPKPCHGDILLKIVTEAHIYNPLLEF